jgi:prophage regulatory protein
MPTERLNRLFRLKDLPQYCGLRRTQISELVKAGQFPKPIPLSDSGRAVAWLEHDLIAWQSARIAARNATEATTPSKEKVAGAVFDAAVSNGGGDA